MKRLILLAVSALLALTALPAAAEGTTVTATTVGSRPVGVGTNVWGTAQGSPNRPVWVEAKVNGRWSRSQSGTTNATGYYALPLTYGMHSVGVYEFRVGVSTAVGTSYSPTVTLTRTSPLYQKGFQLDPRCMTGRAFCASKAQRKMAWVVDGKVQEVVAARFGAPGFETSNGAWRIFWKNRDHHSTLYDAPMPFSMFFHGGEAIHYSDSLVANGWNGGSHGCINLRDWNAAKRLFELGRVGDKVIVW